MGCALAMQARGKVVAVDVAAAPVRDGEQVHLVGAALLCPSGHD